MKTIRVVAAIIIEDGKFSLSQYKNDGMYLDDIPVGRYYLFLRTKYIEEEQEKYKYYAINNNTEYQKMTYYTMSNYSKKVIIENDDSYPTMMINVTKIKNKNVYDVVIDPGHGGVDSGAVGSTRPLGGWGQEFKSFNPDQERLTAFLKNLIF